MYWFEAVVTVNWKVINRILYGDVSGDKELADWKKILQPLVYRCTRSEKDFLKLLIIHHSLLKLLKNNFVQFKHVEPYDLYDSGGSC